MSTGESITAEGLAALRAELADLEGRARREMGEKIKRARELGDLSENAEYHQSKEEQAHLETRIARLTERLRNARVTEVQTDADVVVFGVPVTITDLDTDAEQVWTIVGATEASVPDRKLSQESPVAKALLGKAPGEIAEVQTPRGVKRFRVERLGPQAG